MDVAIAAEHFCLQAADEGLGTCMLGWFDEARVRSLLGIPDSARPALILALGYAAGPERPPRRRKETEQMSAWNAYPGGTIGRTPARPVLGLVLWLVATYSAAFVGGAATATARGFYAGLAQPAWAPPGWVFGPVWMALFTLMGVSAWMVWRARGFGGARGPLTLYLVHLAANALWSWLFFAWRLGAAAFVEILILFAMVTVMALVFGRIRRPAGWILLPYLVWIAYAAALAWSVWRLNPEQL
jgi:tryptophan-rich sensory protein